MSDSEHRRTVPFYWLAIVVLGALLAGAVYLLVRPPADSADGGDSANPDVGEVEDQSDPDDSDENTDPEETSSDSEISETGPLRAKLSDAAAGFEVESWAESAGLISYGAVEAYEGFYVPIDDDEEIEGVSGVVEPTLIAAGRWESHEDASEWLTDWVEDQAVVPTEFRASGKVPGAEGDDVGEYRYFESSDNAEAGVAWTNGDLGLLLVGAPEVVELLFTQLPL